MIVGVVQIASSICEKIKVVPKTMGIAGAEIIQFMPGCVAVAIGKSIFN